MTNKAPKYIKVGDEMHTEKTKNKKYPLKLTLSNGRVLKVPKQANFSNSFLRCHGCSIMAEYLALQYIGTHYWPITILRWHKRHDKEDIKAKVTVKGVAKGINHYRKNHAVYESTPTLTKLKSAMASGAAVILEQKNPIHSVFLFRDKGWDYMVSYGKVKKVSLSRIIKTATTNKTYKGMVIIK